MKYRQWKKNYKKKHGVNPPLWLDRKKRRRYIRKRVRRIVASLEVNVEIITKGLPRKDYKRRNHSGKMDKENIRNHYKRAAKAGVFF